MASEAAEELNYEDELLTLKHQPGFVESRMGTFIQNIRSSLPFQPQTSAFYTPLHDLDGNVVTKRRSFRTQPYWSLCLNCSFFSFAIIGFVGFIAFALGIITNKPSRFWPSWGSAGDIGEYLAHYPTDFTRDVNPVPCHSQNDYWRRIPLYEAVHYGCISVEADVWQFGDDLYVGHTESALTANRTFRSLYVNPLVSILENQNPKTEFVDAKHNGVFDEDHSQTLVLLVDLKTEPEKTFNYVRDQLQPLREKRFLSRFNGHVFVPGPITVVGTGNTNLDLVISNNEYRDIFLDAPLSAFSKKSPTEEQKLYNDTNSYYASGPLIKEFGYPWRGHYTEDTIERIVDHIQGAQETGLKARYWDTPGWPASLRYSVWELLIKHGTDILNVDDVAGATHGKWGHWD